VKDENSLIKDSLEEIFKITSDENKVRSFLETTKASIGRILPCKNK
jgi:hypothetical protein